MSRVGPIAVWAVAALLAAAAAAPHALRPARALALAAVGLVAVLAAWWSARGARRWLASLLAVLGVVAVVVAGAGVRTWLRTTGPLATLARDGGVADVEVVLVGDPRPDRHGGWWAVGRVERVDGVTTRARALVRAIDPDLRLGTRLATAVTARPLADGRLAWQHVGVAVQPVEAIRVTATPGPVWTSTDVVRTRLRDAAAAVMPPDEAALATGLVTGDTRGMTDRTSAAMRATGLTHLVAVSGSNVAVVVAAALLVGGLLGLGARGRRLLVAVVVVWFVLLTRAEPSVLRAAAMVAVVGAAAWRGTLAHAPHALAAALLLLLLADPLQARSLGLLLSALATGGVLVLTPTIRGRLTWAPGRLGDLLAVTLAAQLAVAPLLLVTFGEVPTASVPANLVAVPAAAIASVVLTVATVVAMASVDAAAALLPLARPPLRAVLAAATTFQGRGEVVALARPLTVVVTAGVALWLLAAHGGWRRLGAAVALGLVGGSVVPVVAARPDALVVTAIDVGQGDAILVETPATRMLVDAGPDGTAAAWLRRRGIDDLDVVVLSHPHLDHVGGLAEVVAGVRVAALWWRPVPQDADPARDLERVVGARRVPTSEPSTGDRRLVGDLEVEVLSPGPGRPFAGSEREVNDTSLVLRVAWRGRVALLTGDVEVTAQEELLRRASGRLPAGLLKVPHHGAGTTTEAFLAAVRPRIGLVSAGRDNGYGHPHPETLGRLDALGVTVRRTDSEGTVRVEVPATGAALHPVGAHRERPSGWLRSGHDLLALPRDRRRRPPAAPGGRASARPAPGRRPRAQRRDLRRQRDRAPPRATHRVALRRQDLRRPAGW